jgi:hypothetical protein
MDLAEAYLQMAIAPSTQRNYSAAVRSYQDFCSHHSCQAFPPVEDNLMMYATHVASYSSHANIKVHLSAIKFATIVQGMAFPIFQRLYLLVRGIRRSQGKSRSLPPRLPITPALLVTIHGNLFNSSIVHEDKLMLWAALMAAFFGFLRVSEYTSTHKTKFDKEVTLLCSDLSFSGSVACLVIKASKTDPFRQGVTIRLAANDSFLCPVTALRQFLLVHPTRTGPLFTYQSKKFLTPKDVNKLLVDTTNGLANTTSHSLRIGAASTAAAMGCPKWLIQTLGRWTSDCYRRYIRLSVHTLINASHVLANCTNPVSDHFDPLR